MRTKKIGFNALFLAMVAAFTMLFVTGARVAKADTPVFEFENGAYVKLVDGGGLRFRLKMDETTALEIKDNADETLYFYVGSAVKMATATDGAAAKELYEDGKAWQVKVDKDKIYLGKDAEDNDFYFANVLLDINALGASNGAYYTTDFVAAATVYDDSSTSYLKFVKSIDRNLQNTASAGALRGGFYSQISNTYSWLGTEDYPIVASNAVDYTALTTLLADNSSLYFYLEDVADENDLLTTYDNGTITTCTVTWQDAQGVLSDKVETADYGTTPTFPWKYFEKVGDGTYIYNISVEKSTDGGETWGIASSHIGDYGESAMQPWGMDLNEFNAGLSAVTGDTIYKVNYNELNPVSVVSGGEGFTVEQDGNEFTFTNVAADGSTVNRFMIHSDLLRYYFNADETFLTLKVESAAGQSASFSVNTYWGYDANGGVVKSASGTDTVYVPAYHILSKAVSERHYWVDVVITDISDCDSFVLTIDFADTMYIKNATELLTFIGANNAEYKTGKYELANDIDLGSATIVAPFDNSGNRRTTSGFNGTFDGKGYTISNGEYGQAGLFGNILSDAVVKNFNLNNAAWKGTGNDAALLAWTVSGSIQNVNIDAVYGSAKTVQTRVFMTYENYGATVSDVNVNVTNNNSQTTIYPVFYWNNIVGEISNVSVFRLGVGVLETAAAGTSVIAGVTYDFAPYFSRQDTNGNINVVTEGIPGGKVGSAIKLTRSAGASGWATRFTLLPSSTTTLATNKSLLAGKYLIFDFYYTASSGAVFRPNNNYVSFDVTSSINSSYVKIYNAAGSPVDKITANAWYTFIFDGNMLYGDRASGDVGNMYFNLGDTVGGGNIANFDFANNAAYFADIRIIDEKELFASGLWTLNESNFQKVSATNSVIATVTEDLPDGREGEAVKLTRNIGASAWADGRFIIAPAGSVDYSKKLLAGNYLVLDLYYTKDAGLVFRPNNNYVNFDATKALNSSYVKVYDESGNEVEKITANKWYTLVFDGNMLYGDRTSGSIGNMILTLGDSGTGANISSDANYYNGLAAYFMNMRVVSANPFADIN